MYPTPTSRGVQAPAPEPLCGTPLRSLSGTHCGDPAVWHIRWEHGTTDTEGVVWFDASLVCDPHMTEHAANHVWHDRHPAGPACSYPDPTWQPTGCTTTEEH